MSAPMTSICTSAGQFNPHRPVSNPRQGRTRAEDQQMKRVTTIHQLSLANY
ncbi:hypothetical protein HYC85_023593 [Camellia sinensis]|uniref:Uncharacterized protein n=1 Tax=Camellia sinensis TaxID=4442 RepID=A0A7J7GIS0_CAMSI|nr:hypothetical protein HYC85_023593 [Camellia sinensis]